MKGQVSKNIRAAAFPVVLGIASFMSACKSPVAPETIIKIQTDTLVKPAVHDTTNTVKTDTLTQIINGNQNTATSRIIVKNTVTGDSAIFYAAKGSSVVFSKSGTKIDLLNAGTDIMGQQAATVKVTGTQGAADTIRKTLKIDNSVVIDSNNRVTLNDQSLFPPTTDFGAFYSIINVADSAVLGPYAQGNGSGTVTVTTTGPLGINQKNYAINVANNFKGTKVDRSTLGNNDLAVGEIANLSPKTAMRLEGVYSINHTNPTTVTFQYVGLDTLLFDLVLDANNSGTLVVPIDSGKTTLTISINNMAYLKPGYVAVGGTIVSTDGSQFNGEFGMVNGVSQQLPEGTGNLMVFDIMASKAAKVHVIN